MNPGVGGTAADTADYTWLSGALYSNTAPDPDVWRPPDQPKDENTRLCVRMRKPGACGGCGWTDARSGLWDTRSCGDGGNKMACEGTVYNLACINANTHTHNHTHILMHTHTRAHTYNTLTHVHAYTNMHTCIHTETNMHTCIHIIHTQKQTCARTHTHSPAPRPLHTDYIALVSYSSPHGIVYTVHVYTNMIFH
jgi:hypothetical protein